MKQIVKNIVTSEEVIRDLGSLVIIRDSSSEKKIKMSVLENCVGFNIYDKSGGWVSCQLTLEEAIAIYNKL